ncbi:MAG: ATP-binding protein [Promethearchaeota archaeon]
MDLVTIKDIVVEQWRLLKRTRGTVKRDILDEVGSKLALPHVLIISGMRRVGKSTLIGQVLDRYFADAPVFYFNFEDERLLGFNVDDFNKLHEAFLEIVGPDAKAYVLDEVQNVPDWEAFVRRMHDAGWKFILTGSNATMLSKELGTRLTGRYVRVELFPFSFAEFLRCRGISVPSHLTTADRAAAKRALREYTTVGGIPEQIIYGDPDIAKMLFENILYRDIVARYKVGDVRALKELAFYLVFNPATEVSYRRLASMISVGSVNTVKNYVEYMEEAYLVTTVYRFDYSVRRQLQAPKKIYVTDPGFVSNVGFNRPAFTGKLLENLVLVELKRRGKEVFYHKRNYECDFVVVEDRVVTSTIQVTTSLGDEATKNREFRGLLEAMKSYGVDEGLIVTEDEEYEESVGGYRVRVVPAWKWLMGLA